jgi:hypothetical protein
MIIKIEGKGAPSSSHQPSQRKERRMTEQSIYIITKKMMSPVLKRLNSNDVWIEGLINYIDKKHLATHLNLNKVSSISGVYVNEERAGKTPYNNLRYNEDFQKRWGNQPIYGNVIVIVGEATYDTLNSPYKVSKENLDTISL